MARALLIIVVVLATLVKLGFSQSATEGWMFAVTYNDPKFYLYNPTIDPPAPEVSFDPWPTGAPGEWNESDMMDAIGMDSTNNQLIFPKCRVFCPTCSLGCTSCDMWSYDVVTGALNKFLSNWPPCADWVTDEEPPTPVAGGFAEGGWVTIQPWQNAGLASDEAYLWHLPVTFNSGTKTYTPGAPKRYILKVSGCPRLSNNNGADIAYNSVTKEAFFTPDSRTADCDLVKWDASTIATATNGTTFTGTAIVASGLYTAFMGMSCDNVLYGNDCYQFYTVDQDTGAETYLPATANQAVCWDLSGSVCGTCPLHAPPEVCTPGPSPSPGPGPGPACAKSKIATAATRPAGKVAPFKNFGYTATLVNPRRAANHEMSTDAQAQAKSFLTPFANVTFSTPVPAGVNMTTYRATPKTATMPTIADGQLTWFLGHIKPGGKVKVSLKLFADACTTPDALALDGKFSYFDSAGLKTVDACLKKPLYVTSKTCPPAPKFSKGDLKEDKAGEMVAACTCPLCRCKGNACTCPKDCCTAV